LAQFRQLIIPGQLTRKLEESDKTNALTKIPIQIRSSVWGIAFNSNVEIIQRFQNKYLGIIEMKKLSQRYADRSEEHSNTLTSDAETPRGLKRKLPRDLCVYKLQFIEYMPLGSGS